MHNRHVAPNVKTLQAQIPRDHVCDPEHYRCRHVGPTRELYANGCTLLANQQLSVISKKRQASLGSTGRRHACPGNR